MPGTPHPSEHLRKIINVESVSIVIPAFNEEKSLAHVVREVQQALADFPAAYEIIIVDDGSRDRTLELARSLADEHVRVLSHEQNRGSGQAIRTGLAAATMDLTIFVPADGQFDPKEIVRFAQAAAGYDIVLGYRSHRDSYSIWRKMQSSVYLHLVNFLFGQRFRDVNWVQMWRTQTAGRIELQSSGVFMQQELISRAQRRGMKITEVPSSFLSRTAGLAKGSSSSTIRQTIREMLIFRFGRDRLKQ
ncbi:MAG TPA: glycosyltransferase family 2 protein [bacterium]|nr:glycosyltransferase family 2 protein [bacterium]